MDLKASARRTLQIPRKQRSVGINSEKECVMAPRWKARGTMLMMSSSLIAPPYSGKVARTSPIKVAKTVRQIIFPDRPLRAG